MYYVTKNNELVIFDDDRNKLEKTREFMPQLKKQPTLETNIITADELRAHPSKVVVENGMLMLNPDYEQEEAEKREVQFNKEFFNTSLGYIRRTVTMKDGSKKDFLGELLMPIKAGLELGTDVTIITYVQPDFSEDVTDWTQYQELKQATPQFIQECLNQIVIDFQGVEA